MTSKRRQPQARHCHDPRRWRRKTKPRAGSIIASCGIGQRRERSSVRHLEQRRIHRYLDVRIAIELTFPFHKHLRMGRQDGLGVTRDVAS
jgi:hypothetical protein